MSTENGNEDVFAEMGKVIDQKYLYLTQKNNALHAAAKAKAPNVSDLQIEVALLQEDFDRVIQAHKSYTSFLKANASIGKKVIHEPATEEKFKQVVTEMKSNSMGSIVATIPTTK